MYKAILFDLDDTLMDLQACEAEALRKTLSKVPLQMNVSENWSDVRATYASISSQYWKQHVTVRFTRDQVIQYSLRDTLQKFGENETLVSDLAIDFWIQFCQSPQTNAGADDILRILHGQYKLGVVTNGYTQSQHGRLEAAGWMPLLGCVVISEEAGIAKPDARIFERALEQLDVKPNEALYVGDSISHDYQGCQNAGLDFCHYHPKSKPATDLPVAKYRISHFNELLQLLKDD